MELSFSFDWSGNISSKLWLTVCSMISSQSRGCVGWHSQPHRLYLRSVMIRLNKVCQVSYPSTWIHTHPSVSMRNARKENKRHRWTFPGHTDCPGRSRRQGESCLWNQVASQLRSQSQPRWVGREPRAGKRALSRPPNFCRHLLPICQSRESAQSFTMSVFGGKVSQLIVSWIFLIIQIINKFLDIFFSVKTFDEKKKEKSFG